MLSKLTHQSKNITITKSQALTDQLIIMMRPIVATLVPGNTDCSHTNVCGHLTLTETHVRCETLVFTRVAGGPGPASMFPVHSSSSVHSVHHMCHVSNMGTRDTNNSSYMSDNWCVTGMFQMFYLAKYNLFANNKSSHQPSYFTMHQFINI